MLRLRTRLRVLIGCDLEGAGNKATLRNFLQCTICSYTYEDLWKYCSPFFFPLIYVDNHDQ